MPEALNAFVERLVSRGSLLFAVRGGGAAGHSFSRQGFVFPAILRSCIRITSRSEQEGIPVIMCSAKAASKSLRTHKGTRMQLLGESRSRCDLCVCLWTSVVHVCVCVKTDADKYKFCVCFRQEASERHKVLS